jgi:transposase
MKKLIVKDPLLVLAIQDEIKRSEQSKYDHRLHAVLLVTQGLSGREVARLLGDSARTVQNWVNQFNEKGFAGLLENYKSGRPKKLTSKQLSKIEQSLRKSPRDFSLETNVWDGKTLSMYIERVFDVQMGVRQCQRLFRELGFRYRKPRSMIACSDPELKELFKKK